MFQPDSVDHRAKQPISRCSDAQLVRYYAISVSGCSFVLNIHGPVIFRLNSMDEIVSALLEIVVAQTGRAIIWLVSFGKWRGEKLLGNEGQIYGAAGALWFVRDGSRVVTTTGLLFVGGAFYVLLVACLLAWYATA